MSVGLEEKLALQKISYFFNNCPVVIDIGSNKGDWSDILLSTYDYKGTHHFFEPNELLLNYTRIRYEYNQNIVFNDTAVWSEDGIEKDFYFFTNFNNELSSLVKHPIFETLPMQEKKVKTVSLDTYFIQHGIEHADIIKMDAEGVEYEILKGMKNILENNKVSVIQLEYAKNHAASIGATFSDIYNLLTKHGFIFHDFKDGNFYIVNDENIDEESAYNFICCKKPLQNTQDWNSSFKENTAELPRFDFVLEIGAFEGLTSKYICENLLKSDGRMIVIDPLQDQYLTENIDSKANEINSQFPYFFGQYERFRINTYGYPIQLIRKTTLNAKSDIQDFMFDFVYVDGDHRKDFVYADAITSFVRLKKGGYMLFDDYHWEQAGTKEGIDAFVKEYKSCIEIVKSNEQLLIKKTC